LTKLVNSTIRRVEQRDAYFFEGYGKTEIHDEMLADERRVYAYKSVLNKVSQGKVVADVGAGTGVLSIFAAEGGASKVYAIENA
jgi:predicted RNA methylase